MRELATVIVPARNCCGVRDSKCRWAANDAAPKELVAFGFVAANMALLGSFEIAVVLAP